MPSKREALTVTVIMALFLLLTSIFIGLRSEHLLMAVLYLVLFFAGLPTRKLAVALLPFAIFGISYDWMRICPNYEVNPIDVAGLYNLEKSLFGVTFQVFSIPFTQSPASCDIRIIYILSIRKLYFIIIPT